MSENRVLRRDTLAKFLPSLEAIVAFENLFQQATESTPENISVLEDLVFGLLSRKENLQQIRTDIAEIKAYLGI